MQNRAQEFGRLDGLDGHRALVGQELVAGLGTVLLPTGDDLTLDLEQDLDGGKLTRLVDRARIQPQEPETEIAFGETSDPLLLYTRVALRKPVEGLRVHCDDIGVPGGGELQLVSHGPLENCLRAVEGLNLAVLIRVGVEALLELTGLVQLGVHGLSLCDAQVAATAGTPALQDHRLKALGALLGAVVDALREVPDPAFLQIVGLAVGQPALEDVSNLIEIVPVPRSAPSTTAGQARVQVVVVGRAVLAEQQVLLVELPLT